MTETLARVHEELTALEAIYGSDCSIDLASASCEVRSACAASMSTKLVVAGGQGCE